MSLQVIGAERLSLWLQALATLAEIIILDRVGVGARVAMCLWYQALRPRAVRAECGFPPSH